MGFPGCTKLHSKAKLSPTDVLYLQLSSAVLPLGMLSGSVGTVTSTASPGTEEPNPTDLEGPSHTTVIV